MGAALATRRVDVASEPHWPLLREYLGHSVRSLSECASIFLGRGTNGLDGPDDDEDPEDDDDGGDGFMPSAYPRYLTLELFEEVYGLLVTDARPHFAFFQPATGSGNIVCAHQVFCGLALLARGDLHAKVQFLLRLYATDAHGQLPTERRRMLLRDVVATVPRVFALVEPIESHVVSYLEKELLGRDGEGPSSCRELYNVCFTTARISGLLHEVQLLVHDLAQRRDKQERGSTDQHTPTPPAAVSRVHSMHADGSGHLKLLNRGATMLQLSHEALLWSMRARDLPWFWRQDHVVLPEETLVRDALGAMKRHDNASAMLVTRTAPSAYTGFLTLDDLLCFFVDLLPEDAAATPSIGEYMRAQVVKAGQLFAFTSLRVVLLTVANQTAKSRAGASNRSSIADSAHHCVHSDECFFNVILRLACGAPAIAVLTPTIIAKPAVTSGSSPSPSDQITRDPLLGRISALDALEWLMGDLSLLNGKERFAVASFPWFYYTPTTLVIAQNSSNGQQRPWLLDAVVAMRTQRSTGVLVTFEGQAPASVLSAECIREVFAAQESLESDDLNGNLSSPVDALTPLQVLLTKVALTSERVHFVQSDDSLAHVICTMVATQSRRVYIQDLHSGSVQGAIRATDVLRLLLQEQHRKPRGA